MALQPVHRGLRPVSMEDGILASALALTSTRREVRFGSVWSIGQSCRALNSSFHQFIKYVVLISNLFNYIWHNKRTVQKAVAYGSIVWNLLWRVVSPGNPWHDACLLKRVLCASILFLYPWCFRLESRRVQASPLLALRGGRGARKWTIYKPPWVSQKTHPPQPGL